MKTILKFAGILILCYGCRQTPPRFTLLSSDVTGIAFNNEIHENDSFNILRNEYMYNGGGVGIADLNNDGLQDVVFTGNKVSSRVYLNLGGLKFRDITGKLAGLNNSQWFSGVAVADVNADGWTDLYFTSTMSNDSHLRKNRLWLNQGVHSDGLPHFVEVAETFGIADDGHSMHALFFDYELDGDLDLYVLNNIVGKQVPTNYRPKIMDGTAPNNDRLYQNQGDGKFRDVSVEAGIVYEGYGLGVAAGDLNRDGFPDLYVSNDYISNDLLYLNQGNGTFKNVAEEYMSYQSKFSMGNDMADYNNDGLLDIISLDMMPQQYFRKKQTINGNSYYFYINDDRYGYQHQYIRNMLHQHNGIVEGKLLPFSEIGQLQGVFQTEWSWSPLFADFDNDGDKDLLITNGFPKDLTDKDFTNYKAQVHGFVASDKQVIARIPIVKVSNYAFENLETNGFRNVSTDWGFNVPSFSNGAAFADLDNDGDLDYLVNNINDEAFVYKNNSERLGSHSNLRLRLKGDKPNTLGIGAKVEVWTNGMMQYQEHFLSRGYISSIDPTIHFGLGKTDVVDSIRVTWPRGKITLAYDVKSNGLVVLSEAEGVDIPKIQSTPRTALVEPDSTMLRYKHQSKDYIDFFQGQNIMPHKFSLIGPCMAQGDIDNDGKEDLLIGATTDQPTQVFVQRNRRFEQATFPGLTDQKRCTESDLIMMDVDQDGDTDVVALAGGYAVEENSEYKHFLYRNESGTFVAEELPLPPFVASVVRAFDYDNDGDKDIFVGSRVKRGSFPLAGPSFILTNDKGRFTASERRSWEMGMVTDAVWSDYNGDGWVDLLVTRNWNSLVLMQNMNGNFEDVGSKALSRKHGLWYSVVAADLDRDGDDDYLVGNLGDNHRFTINEDRPMRLYAIDVDRNGSIDPLTTAYWTDKDGKWIEYPVNYLDELAAQSPFFRRRFTSYTEFSYTSFSQIINPDTVRSDRKFFINTTSSYVLWNNGGKFTWQELPSALQVAPLKKMLTVDINADGYLDVLAAGNDHGYDVSTGNYDANKGVVLLGQPNRQFRVLGPAASGFCVNGQVESMLFFKMYPAVVIVGINGREVQVFRFSEPLPERK